MDQITKNLTDEQNAKLVFCAHLCQVNLYVLDNSIDALFKSNLYRRSIKHFHNVLTTKYESFLRWIWLSYKESDCEEGASELANISNDYVDKLNLTTWEEHLQLILYNSVWWVSLFKSDIEFFSRFQLYDDYKDAMTTLNNLINSLGIALDKQTKTRFNKFNQELMNNKENIYQLIRLNLPKELL